LFERTNTIKVNICVVMLNIVLKTDRHRDSLGMSSKSNNMYINDSEAL